MTPAFDIAETHYLVTIEGYNSLTARHLRSDVAGFTTGYTRSALQSRLINQLTNTLSMFYMRLIGINHLDVFQFHLSTLLILIQCKQKSAQSSQI